MAFKYETENFERLLGTQGFSDQLLKNHFTLYQGYVTNTNKLAEEMEKLTLAGKDALPEFSELRRRFGWEFNGMRLHELYFGNMSKDDKPYDDGTKFAAKMKEDFGSFGKWEKDFKNAGAMRGIGWVILFYDTTRDRLWNVWVNEHDTGHLTGTAPLLIMDVFEHAFMLDYGVKKAGYIDAFFNAVCWKTVDSRFEEASLIAARAISQSKAA